MIEGNWSSAALPFRYRVLAPLLASVMPFAPTDSLKIVSYVSLFLGYVFIILSCTKLDLTIGQSAIGLLSVWASTVHLYNYHNPFLTDSLGFLMTCAMIYALLTDNFTVFLVAAFLGVLTRESIVFLAPVWLIRDVKRAVVLTIGCIVGLLVLRHMLGSQDSMMLISAFRRTGVFNLEHPMAYGATVFLCWSYVWFLALMGMWYLPMKQFIVLSGAFVVLLVGAFFTSMVATDTGRMFSVLLPVFAVACARLYAVTEHHNRVFALLLLSLFVLQPFLSRPNILFSEGSWAFSSSARYAVAFVGTAFCALLLLVLRKSFAAEVQAKISHLYAVAVSQRARTK